MRRDFEMTEDQLSTLLDACKPTPCIKIGSYITRTPQENANDAWQSLGNKLGFDYMTVQQVPGKSQLHFSAVETDAP